MAANVQRALARATKLGIGKNNPIAGYGDKARAAQAPYKASPKSSGHLLNQTQFNWFQKPVKTMMQTYPWSGGKHAASTSAASAKKNAAGTDYVGKRRSGAEKDNLNGYI